MRPWKHGKKSSIAFRKYFSKIIRQMKETNKGKFLIETDFLDTRSYFLPTNQNARLTIHDNQSKFVWCHSRVPYFHLNTAIDQWECAYYSNYFIKVSSIKTAKVAKIARFNTSSNNWTFSLVSGRRFFLPGYSSWFKSPATAIAKPKRACLVLGPSRVRAGTWLRVPGVWRDQTMIILNNYREL